MVGKAPLPVPADSIDPLVYNFTPTYELIQGLVEPASCFAAGQGNYTLQQCSTPGQKGCAGDYVNYNGTFTPGFSSFQSFGTRWHELHPGFDPLYMTNTALEGSWLLAWLPPTGNPFDRRWLLGAALFRISTLTNLVGAPLKCLFIGQGEADATASFPTRCFPALGDDCTPCNLPTGTANCQASLWLQRITRIIAFVRSKTNPDTKVVVDQLGNQDQGLEPYLNQVRDQQALAAATIPGVGLVITSSYGCTGFHTPSSWPANFCCTGLHEGQQCDQLFKLTAGTPHYDDDGQRNLGIANAEMCTTLIGASTWTPTITPTVTPRRR